VFDFDEIWHGDAYIGPLQGIVRKNFECLKIQDGGVPMLKITKIAISPKRFDRFLRNLVWLFQKGSFNL